VALDFYNYMINKHIYSPPRAITLARWIWQGLPNTDLHNGYALFRRVFNLSSVPAKARIWITADQAYRLYINGDYVCGGPARGFQAHWPFDEVDVRPWLKKGKNILAVRAYNPGCGTFAYVSKDTAGLLLALEAGETLVVSDPSWKSRRQSGVRKDSVPLAAQLAFQENIDLREEPDDWMEADFDDSGWQHPKESGRAWNAMPWYSLEPRGIPLLSETEILRGRAIGFAKGKSAKGFAFTRDVFLNRYQEGLAHKRLTGKHWPLQVTAAGEGAWSSHLVDFSKTVVGLPILEVSGAKGGEIVDLTFYETLDSATLAPHVETNSWSDIAMGNRAILRAGVNVHPFFHPIGFRYAVLTIRGATSPLRLDFSVRRIAYPFKREGSFHSSDATLNAIWESCAWTQECCSLDAYVDTPWREQAQWWGDARVQAWNTFHFCNDARLLRRGIHCIASQTTPNGLTYGHAPTKAHSCILPDFSLTWILTLWDHYWQTGSTEAFDTHEGIVVGILDYFRGMTDEKTGLVRFDPRYWLFLDWTTLHKEGCPSVLNLWLLEALDKLVELYHAAGREAPARPLAAWAKRLRKALLRLMSAEGLIADGYDAKGKIVAKYSLHSQTLAMITGLASKQEHAMLEKRLLPYIRGEEKFEAMPSAYWSTYLFTELSKRGHGAEVVAFIKKHWVKMAEHGTTWETFAPALGNESHSHAWSAHPLFHLMQIIGGIRQTSPGWKTVSYTPSFIGDSLDCAIPTPQGLIRSQWKRTGNKLRIALSLPPKISASCRLPEGPEFLVRDALNHTIEIS
jgi:alpha-L-rhamnosidase